MLNKFNRYSKFSHLKSNFRSFNIFRGEEIVKAGDFIDFLGILVSGSAFVIIDHKNLKDLKLGDMIGHMFAADLTTRETHLTTIVASMDGLLAVLPFGEIKAELRRAPEAVFKCF